MLRRCAPVLGSLLLLSCLTSTPAFAEGKQATAPSDLAPVLELLRSKNLITADEAAALSRQGADKADNKGLIELLRSKGIISGNEAAGLAATEPIPPSQDKKFIAYLRERWVKNKNRARDFDEWFAGNSDPDDIIGRMRVMGAISAEESEQLTRLYRDNYMTGVVAAALEHKEQEYLERVRKDVAWELDEKIKDQLKNEWSRRIRLSGDVRLRYEGDFYGPGNGDFLKPDNPGQIMNSKQDRHMMRLRGRLGIDAKISDDWQAGLAIATENSRINGNPVSTNVTLGDFFNKKPIALDKGFIKWSPDPSLSIVGGHFANPWLFTDLVWDTDLNFDGIALQYSPQLTDRWSLFFTSGAFPLQEVELSSHDKWLFGNQLGMKYQSPSNMTAKLGVAYYDFVNTVGQVNDPTLPGQKDYTAPQFQQKGNTLMDIDPTAGIKTAYASAFRELNVTGVLDLGYWEPVHVVFTGDYVKNLGFRKGAVQSRTGVDVDNETTGFQLGISVGHPEVRELWDWRGYFNYKYLESDAVMDAFTDSDFHLGGTNAKGWIVGSEVGLGKNVWLSGKWLSANEITGPPLSIDVFQLDLNAKF